jgi:hypothetical protein
MWLLGLEIVSHFLAKIESFMADDILIVFLQWEKTFGSVSLNSNKIRFEMIAFSINWNFDCFKERILVEFIFETRIELKLKIWESNGIIVRSINGKVMNIRVLSMPKNLLIQYSWLFLIIMSFIDRLNKAPKYQTFYFLFETHCLNDNCIH